MRCEVVAIGTELLLGQIVDTNSSWIGEQLALAGIDSLHQTKVGDNAARMDGAIRQGLERADAVICCGGLGPTQDDITREVIAGIMGVELKRDDEIVDRIRHMFESRGRVMTANNLRQAEIPVGAAPIAQMPGTAPGLVCPIGDKVIYAVPGVPHEMREMMVGTILPDLRRRSGQTAVIRSRVMRTWGESESGLAEILADRIRMLDEQGNPTLAFQASGIEGIKVRITAKSADEATADTVIAAEEAIIRDLLGDTVFGVDDESMEVVVLNALRARGLTLGVAESVSGGLLSSRLSAIDTEMQTFCCATITPFADGPEDANLSGEERAAAYAARIRAAFGTDVAITAFEPEPEAGQRPGTVYLGVAIGDEQHGAATNLFGDRNRKRNYSVISILNLLRKILAETD
jgi:nicotinamide-nucleotide amidase